jgi:hypothetical protein
MEKLESILKESKYKKAISLRQSDDAKNGFDPSETPKWYTDNKEPIPEAGRDKGLTLVLDGHSNRLSRATVPDNFRGFVTVVNHKNKFPLISQSNLIIRPGFENEVKVSAMQVHALEEIKKYAPEKRNCYFPDEYELEAHKFYSRDNCIFECETRFAAECLKKCNKLGQTCDCSNVTSSTEGIDDDIIPCIPWFFPTNDKKDEKMCNPWNRRKFQQILKKQIPKQQCKHCLPDCSTTKYDTAISYAEFHKCDQPIIGSTGILCDLTHNPLNPAPWTHIASNEYGTLSKSAPWYFDTLLVDKDTNATTTRFSDRRSKMTGENMNKNLIFPTDLKQNPTYDAFEKDIAIINIFFSDKELTKFVKSNRMSTYGFLAQIGGSLGFAMGVSIITMIEFFYWFTFQLFRNVMGNKDNKVQSI